MVNKRSGIGIAAGILYSLLLLHTIGAMVCAMIEMPEFYAWPIVLWRIPDVLGWCAGVFVILSLFRDRRSWLLLSAYLIYGLLIVWDWITDRISGYSVSLVAEVLHLITTLTAVMVVFCCVPAMRRYADWTAKVWFLPAAAGVLLYLAGAFWNREYILYLLKFHQINLAEELVVNFAMAQAALLLFCRWLTEPFRKIP